MVSKTDNITAIPDLGGAVRLSEADAALAINRYIQNIGAVDTATHPGANLLGFYELVQEAVASRQASEHVPDDKRLLVLADDPPESVDTEAITFFMRARAPGQFNKGPAGTGRVREVVAHVRSIQQHPEHPSEKLVTMGRFYDNWVVFNIYARDDYTAFKRVLWFENVMDSYRWYFGLHRIKTIEEGVGDRARVTIGELPLTKYPITFMVRTEDTYQFGSQELKRLALNVNVSTNIEEG
jgi:hypothetical protein